MRKLDRQIRQTNTAIRQKHELLAQIEHNKSELLRMSRLLHRQIQLNQNDIKNASMRNEVAIPSLLQSIIARRKNIKSSIKTLNRLEKATNIKLEEAIKELQFLETRKQQRQSP